jgi:hypothetical protein
VRGRFRHAIVGSKPSTEPNPRPNYRGGEGILGFVDAYCHAKQRSPESRPQVDLGVFLSASAFLRQLGRTSDPAMCETKVGKADTTEERADS